MENFSYHRPAKAADAVKAMKKAKDGKYMSGGMTLLPTIKQGLATPTDVIDLSGLKSSGVAVSAKAVTVKAGTTHAEVATDKAARKAIPALAALAYGIGDPAADYPAAALGLGATIHTSERKLAADKFFTGMFSTALKSNEIVTAVEFPIPAKAGYAKFPNPASRYAMVGVFVAKMKDGSVRVAVTGAGPGVFRIAEMEAALAKDFSAKAISGISAKAKGLNSDMHASAEYRAHLIGVMARRAVEAAK